MHGTQLGEFSSPLPVRAATLLCGPDDRTRAHTFLHTASTSVPYLAATRDCVHTSAHTSVRRYGPDDSVTSVPDIQAFAQEWRQAGVDPVEEVTFSDTTHVQHLPSHPQQYGDAIGRLLDRALG